MNLPQSSGENYDELRPNMIWPLPLALHKDVRRGIVEDRRPDGRQLTEIDHPVQKLVSATSTRIKLVYPRRVTQV